MNPLLRGILGFKSWSNTSLSTTPSSLIVDYTIFPTNISNWSTKLSVSTYLSSSCTTLHTYIHNWQLQPISQDYGLASPTLSISYSIDKNFKPKLLLCCFCKTRRFQTNACCSFVEMWKKYISWAISSYLESTLNSRLP